MIEIDDKKEVLVLYSGGRDSSASAVLMAQRGYDVKLFSCQDGSGELMGFKGDSAPDIRHKELLKIFPKNINLERIIKSHAYLIRKLGVEKTNKEHVVYPLALTLAFHSVAIKYCLENNITIIVSGYSGYQSNNEKYVEQHEDFVNLTRKFLKDYGISYETPVINKTEKEIKDILEKNDISSNSLEGKSLLFGGIPFDIKYVYDYWNSSIPICREYLNCRPL